MPTARSCRAVLAFYQLGIVLTRTGKSGLFQLSRLAAERRPAKCGPTKVSGAYPADADGYGIGLNTGHLTPESESGRPAQLRFAKLFGPGVPRAPTFPPPTRLAAGFGRQLGVVEEPDNRGLVVVPVSRPQQLRGQALLKVKVDEGLGLLGRRVG